MSSLHELDELLPHLRLLGTMELHVRGRVLRQFGGRSCALLLARLALAPRKAHPRETLVDLIWPDADLDAGRNRLRNALSVLRSTLAEAGCDEMLVADRESVRLAPGTLACDVQRFEEAVGRQQWLDARHAYAGELLPGHFEDWVLEERQRLACLAERIPPGLPELTGAEQQAMGLIDRASLLARRGAPDFEARAIALLEQAVQCAPGFTLARLRLAGTLANRALRLVGPPRREQLQLAREQIDQALLRDPHDPRARAMSLVYRYRHDLDFTQVRDALMALARRHPEASAPLSGLVIIHNDIGHATEAEAFQRQAHRLDPLSVTAIYNIAVARLNGYRFASALEAFDQVLELEPAHGVSLVGRFFALAGLARWEEAWAHAQEASRLGAIASEELGFYQALCAQWSGRPDAARALYTQPATVALCEREPAYGVLRHLHLGETDAAVSLARRMMDDGDPNLLVVFGSRNGLDTRQEPRLEALARALGWRPVHLMLDEARRAEADRRAQPR